MMNIDNRGALRLSKKGWIILIGSILATALVIWSILVVGIFRNKNRNKNSQPEYKIHEVPEGYVLVFRAKRHYEISKKGKRNLSFEDEYDDFGRIISNAVYSDGKIDRETKYVYDDGLNVIRETEYDGEGNVLTETENTYDSEGRLIEQRRNDVRQTFNENGNLLTEYKEETDGNFATWKKVKENVYADDGRILTETDYLYGSVVAFFYDNSGKKERIETRKNGELYSEENFLTEYESEYYEFTDDGAGCLKSRRTYDGKGFITHTVTYNEDGTVRSESTVEFDEHGNPTKSVLYENGKFGYWNEYEYDDASVLFKKSYCRMTSKNEDGTVQYTIVRNILPEFGITEQTVYNGDGTVWKNSTVASMWYWEKDAYGNPIRLFILDKGNKILSEEAVYIPMVIPKEYLNDYDRFVK